MELTLVAGLLRVGLGLGSGCSSHRLLSYIDPRNSSNIDLAAFERSA